MKDSREDPQLRELLEEMAQDRGGFFSHPGRVEDLAARLAPALPDADVMLHWDDEDDAVVAHAVARYNGMGRRSMVLDQGVFSLSHPLPPKSRVVVLQLHAADMTKDAIATFLARDGHLLLGVFTPSHFV